MISERLLAAALENAIRESIATSGQAVELTVANPKKTCETLEAMFGANARRRLGEGTVEVKGTWEGEPWELLVKRKP